jgi:hypothetical protein
MRLPFGVSRWPGPDGEPLAGQSPLGVSHWLPPSGLRPRAAAVMLLDCPLFRPNLLLLLSFPHLSPTAKIAHEMTSHDGRHVNLFISNEKRTGPHHLFS